MKRRTPLSPAQTAAYTSGRTLLVFDSWARHSDIPIEVERAMLIDFAVQYPRSISSLIPTVPAIVRAHGIDEGDLGDLFAMRRLATLREDFIAVLSLLVGQMLVEEAGRTNNANISAFQISAEGRKAAGRFSSSLAVAIRALAEAASLAWKRRNTEDLRSEIRNALPDWSRNAAELTRPVDLLEDD
jgi:hypothetical protein